MPHDLLGNEIHVGDAASVARVDAFVGGFIASQARVIEILDAVPHDGSVIVNTFAAALHLFAEAPSGYVNARPLLERAAASTQPASERERAWLAAVLAWADDDFGRAISLLSAIVERHPRDLAAAKLAQYLLFNLGDAPGMLRVALLAQDAAADIAYLHGMTAFAFEQCHLLRDAEAAARRAIAMQSDEAWAHHALAHVMLTEGRIAEGRAFMEQMSSSWFGLNSFMQTHNWWHLALFAIEQGDDAAALAIYDRQVWGVNKEYSQDQIGAVSLLARLELAGVEVGERWQDVSAYLVSRVQDQVLPFLDLQYLYGLARAGRAEADSLLRRIEDYAPRAPELTRAAWQRVAVPAARGLLAHARGDHETAAESMAIALPGMLAIGGSHAQRDLFEQIFIDALARSGRSVAAYDLLRQRANAAPESKRLRRRLAPITSALGLPEPR